MTLWSKFKNALLNSYYRYHKSKRRPHKVYFDNDIVVRCAKIVFVPASRSIRMAFELHDLQWAGTIRRGDYVDLEHNGQKIKLRNVTIAIREMEDKSVVLIVSGTPTDMLQRLISAKSDSPTAACDPKPLEKPNDAVDQAMDQAKEETTSRI